MANVIALSNTDLTEQQVLLTNGYLGFSQFKGEQDIKILFAKKKNTNCLEESDPCNNNEGKLKGGRDWRSERNKNSGVVN